MRPSCFMAALVLLIPACTHEADPELRLARAGVFGGTVDTAHSAVGGIVSKYASGCTATLVGRRTVLTAAHCVCRDAPYTSPELPLTFTDHRGLDYEAEAVVVTPMISGGFWERDLALVRLKQKVPGIVPSLITSEAPSVGETIIVVGRGWGGTSELPGVTRVGTNFISQVSSQHIEFNNTAGAATCKGDSGGPTYAERDGEERLIGVHSAGSAGECGTPYGTALDTRVDVYQSWIVQQAQGDLYAGEPIDTEAPVVSILSPKEGDLVPRQLVVRATATDNEAVTGVSLELDGGKEGELSQPPYEFTVQGLTSGSHTFKVAALDAEGNVGSAQVAVALQPGAETGAPCEADEDCASGLCRGGACTVGCSSLKPCPEGFECQALACVPVEGGGCAVVWEPRRVGGTPFVVLLLVLLATVHRIR